MQKVLSDSILSAPKGFISAFMHSGSPKFVQIGEDPKQGYFVLPKEEISQEMHIKNLIVAKASVFMAKRMRPGASWGDGINYLELGTGVGTGTTQAPQAESSGQTALRVPLIRKAIDSWTYLDVNSVPTATETNVIQLTTLFAEEEANGAIVEMALSGGGATVAIGSGFMFNYKTFPVWNKDNSLKLTVIWKITL